MLSGQSVSTHYCVLQTVLAIVGAALFTTQTLAQERKAHAPKVEEAHIENKSMLFAAGKNSSAWLKFELYAGSRILIPLKVNGRPVVAMLDSGASSTVLDHQFAAQLKLRVDGHHSGAAAGGPVTYSTVSGLDVQLGDLHWTGEAVAIDLSAAAKQIGRPLPIILGGEFFNGAVVDIDFAGQRIAFRDPMSFAPAAQAHVAPLYPAAENQSIPMVVEGRPATLLFDLGNAGAIDLYPRFWDNQDFMKGRKTSTTLAGGAGGMAVQKVAILSELAIGGTEFHTIPVRLCCGEDAVAEAEAGLDGNLGIEVLHRFHLIVDFPHKRVLFEPPIDQVTPFPTNHVGLTTRSDDHGLLILHVASNSPAAVAGLIVGDIIVSVDGVPIDPSKQADWQTRPVGTGVRLRLSDGREVKLTRATYF